MNKHILTLVLTSLMIGEITSCKKETPNVSSPSTTTTTSSTATTSSDPETPLTSRLCSGQATITIDNIPDSMYSAEKISSANQPNNYFIIFCSGTNVLLDIVTGDSILPASTRTYRVMKNPNGFPADAEVALNFYDKVTLEDYYATGGSVTYTVTATKKTVIFTDIRFESADGTGTKTISFSASLD